MDPARAGAIERALGGILPAGPVALRPVPQSDGGRNQPIGRHLRAQAQVNQTLTAIARPTCRAVIRDDAAGQWLNFGAPSHVLATRRRAEVRPLIRRMEEAVRRHGWYAAGFIAYEAAPGFDPALTVRRDGAFPLLWFGLFKEARPVTLPSPGTVHGAPDTWQPSVTPAAYADALRAIRRYLRGGDTYQVNFTYRLRALTRADPWRLFLRLATGGGAPFGAFVDTGEWAVCSASPELFLRLDGDRIESRPMKGTAARGLGFEADQRQRTRLVRSAKDRAENVMIVDMVRNDLGRVAAPGSVRVPALCAAEQYPTVWQMTSTVRARTGASLDHILQAAFPAASITGAPKRRTMEIITELESSPRRLYTGAIGFLAPGRRAQFNVAIRTLLIHKASGRAEYGVGGGIVWDSKPADEARECRIKAQVLRPIEQAFELLETLRWSPRGGYALLAYHLARLAHSAAYFGFRADGARIQAALARFAATLPPRRFRVRLRLSRRGRIRCDAVPLVPRRPPFGAVSLASRPIDPSNVLLYHKTTCRRVYEEALATRPGNDEVILYNGAGQITESTTANVAIERQGELCTPPLRCGLLPGTMRASLLARGRLRERVVRVEELLDSPAVYLFNSVRGMHRITLRPASDAGRIRRRDGALPGEGGPCHAGTRPADGGTSPDRTDDRAHRGCRGALSVERRGGPAVRGDGR